MRIYGGHFFMAGGRLDFVGCLFFDYEILTPMTDRLRFGDKIFVRIFFLLMCILCLCMCTPTFSPTSAAARGCHMHPQNVRAD